MKIKTVLCALALITVFTACGGYDKASDFKVSPVEGGKSVEITGYTGEKLAVKIPPRIQKLPVTKIGDGAFEGEKIASVTIPKSVTVIGNSAFADNSFTGITLPAGLKEIGSYAFRGCENLTSITIPASVTEISGGAFYGCEGLTSINIDSGNPHYASEGGILYNKEKTKIVAVPEGISDTVTIPASVTEIDYRAFAYRKNITEITIPANVTSIGGEAFAGCTGIAEITIPAGVIKIGGDAFAHWRNTQTINIAGHSSQAAADRAWGYTVTETFMDIYIEGWRASSNAKIVYQGGQ